MNKATTRNPFSFFASRCGVVALAALVVVSAGGCAGQRLSAPPDLNTMADQGTLQQEPAPYRLQVGDDLSIRFYSNPELDQDVVVRPDGMISVPYLDDVQAAGLTPAELDARLTKAYTGELATPQITVIVRSFSGNKVFIGGEVGSQGVIPLSGGLTLYQAIQEAGGFLPSAHLRQIIVIRKGPDGRPVGHAVDLKPVQTGENPGNDVLLQPYDVVFVPRSKIANVGLFVKQYIREALPVSPYLGFNLF